MTIMQNVQIKTPTQEERQKAHEDFVKFVRSNPNNFSYWFPHVRKLDNLGISIPRSIIIPIPEHVFTAFFLEKEGDAEKIDRWVLENVVPVINNTPWLGGHKIFIKNGCFSNKFRFSRGCLITDPSDEETLIQNITNIQQGSFFHETYGYMELVLREYIEPEKADTPTIYHGMPLRPEARIFYHFDFHQLLYAVNYWNWEYCHDAICYSLFSEEKTPDAVAYETAYPLLDSETKRLLQKHQTLIEKALATVTTLQMPGGNPNIWSVDFILEEDRVWLIDMAQGWRSSYWNLQMAGV